ncbi:Gfo/Idh/MocA family oxidoreductase [Halotia wernerae UHCC 0503]|nr:Gfo/Idh/MocA family oxidoreductase [Halotia wernerae UHCC 0503]
MNKMRVGIIGTGLQANRRALSIDQHEFSTISFIAGLEESEAKDLANKYNAKFLQSWEGVVNNNEIDIIVVCTPPHIHLEIVSAALKNKKHVLCEKPLTRNSLDAQKLVTIAKENNVILKCGFNHRHHPAMIKAHKIISDGLIGNLITGRALYGICGRQGCEKEWRSDPQIAAGGQLMEQGIHCIDLFRWYVGEFDSVSANIATMIFPIYPLEDTATALLHQNHGFCATVHSSITQWRNRFRFELYGDNGYFEITGLGGSYDLQQIHIGMREPSEPFTEVVVDYRGGDKSWNEEWNHFMNAILHNKILIGSGEDGVKAMRIVEAAYLSSKNSHQVSLEEIKYE